MQATYAAQDPHATTSIIIWLTFGLAIAFTLISVTEWCQHGAYLPSALMVSYFTFIVWLCCLNNPDLDDKNPNATANGVTNYGATITGFFLMILSLSLFIRNPNLLSLSDPGNAGNSSADLNAKEVLPDNEGSSSVL